MGVDLVFTRTWPCARARRSHPACHPKGPRHWSSATPSSSNRDSIQRRRYWWPPYTVLELDRNEIPVDVLAGDHANPVWNYRANL
jgi:hypothetical protein